MPTITGARVVVVSGKGGVGKTTVASAIALAAARRGRRVLLADIENRDSFAPLFGHDSLAFDETPLERNLYGIAILADEALVEYLKMIYGIPKLSRALVSSKAVEFATNTAPGLRDILLIGKVMEAERRNRDGRSVFDLIVVDAPPTGRLPRFLDAPRAIADLVRAGPIERQAKTVLSMVVDPARLHVVLVTTPEDMPVQETVEAAEAIRKMGVALGPLVINGLWREVELPEDPRASLAADAARARLQLDDEALDALAIVTETHARRARHQREALATLPPDIPDRVTLPFLFADRIGVPELDTLGAALDASMLL